MDTKSTYISFTLLHCLLSINLPSVYHYFSVHHVKHEQYHLHHRILCFGLIPTLNKHSLRRCVWLLYNASIRMYSHLALMEPFWTAPNISKQLISLIRWIGSRGPLASVWTLGVLVHAVVGAQCCTLPI